MEGRIGGPGRDRTDDLFHAMEARSQLRHRPTRREQLLYCLRWPPFSQTSIKLPQSPPDQPFTSPALLKSGPQPTPKVAAHLVTQITCSQSPIRNNELEAHCSTES